MEHSHWHHLSVHLEAEGVEADQNLSHPDLGCVTGAPDGSGAATVVLPPAQTRSYWRRACPAPAAAASESPSSAAGALVLVLVQGLG